jgi:hypothetical protein
MEVEKHHRRVLSSDKAAGYEWVRSHITERGADKYVLG